MGCAHELYLSHSIGRHFFWDQNVLWADSIEQTPSLVVLVGKDCIVPSHSVKRYLSGWFTDRRKNNHSQTRAQTRVLFFRNQGHGEWSLNPFARSSAIPAILEEMHYL